MTLLAEILVSALLVISGIFGLIGSFGLLKLPDTMMRLHAPTKAATVGVGFALIASMLYFWRFQGTFTLHELLITLFLFVTAPITGHFIAKAHIHRTLTAKDLPPTSTGVPWAVLAPPHDTEAPGPDLSPP